MDLRGKGAIIIGARRVGVTVAKRLADEGVNLAITYRRSKTQALALRRQVAPHVKKAAVVQCDVADEESVKRMVDDAVRELGSVHFVINLASDFRMTPFHTLDAEAWESMMAQAKGSYFVGVHAGKHLIRNPGPTRGHIILFGDSSAGATPYHGYLPYLTAKAAIEFMTRAFALELAEHRVLVNAISPGPTMRPPDLSADIWKNQVLAGTPLKRQSDAKDIAEMVVALLKSETITGETIRVDSGVHLAGHG